METITNQNNRKSQDKFNISKILSVYFKQWKWFILSCFVSIVLAMIHLKYATPEYNAYAKIMLVDDQHVSTPAETMLKDLGQIAPSEGKAIEDEIEVLLSRRLMMRVVDSLDLNVKYYVKGRLHDNHFFPNEKAPIKLSFISTDSIINLSQFNFSIRPNSETSFDFIYKSSDEEGEEIQEVLFGKNITTPIGDIIVTPNVNNVSNLIGQNIIVNISPVNKVAEYYKNTILITQVSQFSKVINLSLNDPVKVKAQMIIDELIEAYNRSSIEEKQARSKNAAQFINNRINLISAELSQADSQIEAFKTGNKLTNISSEANIYLNSSAQTDLDLTQSRTEYNMINYMKSQVNDEAFARIPSNVGLSDGSINSIAKKYNELLDDRDRLLKSSNEKNPIIVTLDQQLNNIKNSLRNSLDNSAKTVRLKINSLENQSAKLNTKIYAVPGQVRKSKDIEREQSIIESLYLYLLQKREEASISLISTSPNAKVVDSARSKNNPVSPNAPIVLLASIVLGLSVPVGFFYIKDLLDNKIHNKEDLEKEITDITVLGEVPHLSGNKEGKLIQKNDRSVLSESFRIIRTNLDYIRRGRDTKNYDNVIFVTSTINSEGKSFFSMNMALTIATTNKRVLLIGADIRNPQTTSLLSDKNKNAITKIGLTEFLVDKSILVGEAIDTYEVNGNTIDIIASGKVPPNPAELLMNSRMKMLFDTASEQYDYVIVDTAPSMLVTDTLLISKYAGHTIFVTRAGYTEKRILNFAKELHADKKLNGMMLVVNDVKQSNFGYGAKYGYYGAPKKKGLLGRFRKT